MDSVMCFMSYQLTGAQTRWHTAEREAFAVFKCLQEIQWIIQGSPHPIKVHTDHRALLTVLNSDDAHGRISRWQMKLAEFNLTYHHMPGKEMAVADSLSRFNQIAGMPKESYGDSLRNDSDEECDLICHAIEVHSGENSTKQRKGSKFTTVGNPITPSMLGVGALWPDGRDGSKMSGIGA
jgi:hypothetical protein